MKSSLSMGMPPLVSVDLRKMPKQHRFDTWHEVVRPFYYPEALTARDRFSGYAAVAKAGDVLLVDVGFTPQRSVRTRRHAAESDHFQLQCYRRGGVVGSRGGRPFRLGPDRIGLCDGRCEHEALANESSEGLSLCIPRARIDAALPSDRPTVCWSKGTPGWLLLAGAARTLRNGVQQWSAAEARDAAEGFIGLLNGLLGGREDRKPVKRLWLLTIKRYIDAHLHDADLDAATLCRVFGCSRASLYRLFQEHGGVASYLCERRLSRCFAEFAAAPERRGRVRKIAERWGFNDPSHFNRLFKKQFGMLPSEVPADGSTNNGQDLGRPNRMAEAIDQWMRAL
jgi:AraC-like DNA-binding protein